MEKYRDLLNHLIDGLRDIFGNRLEAIVLYGSVARGMDDAESDVDIAAILTDYSEDMHDRMIDMIVDMELEYNKTISTLLIKEDEYRKWKNTMPFYLKMDKEGVTLWKAA